jgi:hypothetical protein
MLGIAKKKVLPLQPASTGGGHLTKKASDKKRFSGLDLESQKVCLPLHSQSPTGLFGQLITA